MKMITISIDDDLYNHLEQYSFEHGEDLSEIAQRCCMLGWTMLDVSTYSIEDWQRERGFGKYGRRKTLSYTLR